ncbi:sensor histidine kinase [Altererythrobacter aquiaggeris]|uniref:sensor histidine kinase n=1 Tax=Aestuarierythrobacter aquiaggeris TaxID=1898396 RepID=UPI0030199A85
MTRLWPRSLRGQVLAAIAVALLIAQGVNLVVLHRGQQVRQEMTVANSAAFRLLAPERPGSDDRRAARRRGNDDGLRGDIGGARAFRPRWMDVSPQRAGERRQTGIEEQLAEILLRQGVVPAHIVAVRRRFDDEPEARQRMLRRAARAGLPNRAMPRQFFIVGVQADNGSRWRVVQVAGIREQTFRGISAIIIQTLLLFLILFGALAVILRRITRPLAALTARSEQFARTRDAADQLEPSGPADVSRLITAHNSLETKIAGLLDEKDVMLGAIGHDLKTPLAALRVRIETVANEAERAKMAETIDGIADSLDDILSLARVGRPTDPLESVELGSLAASIVEEYEDLGEPVTLVASERMVGRMRANWVRRALRNLISNALRYGGTARVSIMRQPGGVIMLVADDGPGIPPADLERMQEPFTRGEPSRNRLTGGAGLGLTLARAIAEQHGGQLTLTNRADAAGRTAGLDAAITMPLD